MKGQLLPFFLLLDFPFPLPWVFQPFALRTWRECHWVSGSCRCWPLCFLVILAFHNSCLATIWFTVPSFSLDATCVGFRLGVSLQSFPGQGEVGHAVPSVSSYNFTVCDDKAKLHRDKQANLCVALIYEENCIHFPHTALLCYTA